ncbi:hypothetical protein FD754_024244 [Muntiacus muntjak]|uniref:Uncharacterized protein n=1 Tax=Muntiacus muntjak TaxID=9888 RepID=A0A5N3UQD1_MUNMU|nr:hypothetical protein FD754_024244 [Muntiacus muntjak]
MSFSIRIITRHCELKTYAHAKPYRPVWIHNCPNLETTRMSFSRCWMSGTGRGAGWQEGWDGQTEHRGLLGQSPGEGNGNPLQYSCLENPMARGAWQATVHGAARVRHDLATKPPLLNPRI